MSYLEELAFGYEAAATKSSVCQLYASRLVPQKNPVRIRASAWVALGHGGVFLEDPACAKVVIRFKFSDDAMARPKVIAFNHAMIGDPMNMRPRIFEVEMVGVFLKPTDESPNGLLNVNDVEWFEQRK